MAARPSPGANAPAALGDAPDEKPAEEAKLPGGTWDTKDLDKNWTVVRRKYDPTRNEVTWVLEAKNDIDAQNHRMGLDVTYYDEDDVRVEVSPLLGGLTFEPAYGFKKGALRLRHPSLPKDEQMRKVKRVVVKSEQ